MRTLVRGTASALVLVALVIGSPMALLQWGRATSLRRLFDGGLWAPDDGTLLLGVATVCGWVAWVVFTGCVAVEAVRLATGARVAVRLPGLSLVQSVAAGLLVASVAVISPLNPHHRGPTTSHAAIGVAALPATGSEEQGTASPEPTTPEPTTTAPSVSADQGEGPTDHGTGTGRSPSAPTASAASGWDTRQGPQQPRPSAAQQRGVDDEGRYVVGPDDDVWTLAQRWYGDGTAWRRIAAANPGIDVTDLRTGQVLVRPTTDGPVTRSVVVVEGDTLSGLARRHLGDAERWPQIWNLNRDLVADPDLIDVGWRLVLPTVEVHDDQDDGARAAHPPNSGHSRPDPLTTATPDSPPTRPVPPNPTPSAPDPSNTDPSNTHLSGLDPSTREAPSRDQTTTEPEVGTHDDSSLAPVGQEQTSASSGPVLPAVPAPGEVADPPSPADPGVETDSPIGPPRTDADEGAREARTGTTTDPGHEKPEEVPFELTGVELDASAVRAALGGLSMFLAGGLAGALATRRSQQLFGRPRGRRVPVAGAASRRVAHALSGARVLTDQDTCDDELQPDHLVPTDQSHASGLPPRPDHVGRSDPPEGLSHAQHTGGGDESDAAPRRCAEPPAPPASPTPTTVVVGEVGRAGHGAPMLVDLGEVDGLLTVAGTTQEAQGLVAAIGLSLACAPWSVGVQVIVVGQELSWLTRAGGEDVTALSPEAVGRQLATSVARPHRLHDVPPAVSRVVVSSESLQHLPDPATLRNRGIVVVRPGAPRATATLVVEGGVGRWDGVEFTPQIVTEPVRRAVVELFEVAGSDHYDPAPWWGGGPGRRPTCSSGDTDDPTSPGPPAEPPGTPTSRAPDSGTHGPPRHSGPPPAPPPARGKADGDVAACHDTNEDEVRVRREDGVDGDIETPRLGIAGGRSAPLLRVLGPVDVIGARGEPPMRSRRQCLEYCAWIHAHPGSGSAQMADSLMVAESTRRSTMSRLRRWLGNAEDGRAFLPEAYDGRIRLDEAITTDWEQVELLLTGGITRAGEANLAAALDLVRGAPLADAAPGQWLWAEEWRIDMIQTIRDVGVELADRRAERGDLAGARRALARAAAACPADEVLLTSQVRMAHRCGDHHEVERLVYLISRQARRLGVDLADETVTTLQEVMEGHARARVV